MLNAHGHIEAWVCDKDGNRINKVVDEDNIVTNWGYSNYIYSSSYSFSWVLDNATNIFISNNTIQNNPQLTGMQMYQNNGPARSVSGFPLYKFYYLCNGQNNNMFSPPSSGQNTINTIGLNSGSTVLAYKVLSQPIIQTSSMYLEVAYTLTFSISYSGSPNEVSFSDLNAAIMNNNSNWGYHYWGQGIALSPKKLKWTPILGWQSLPISSYGGDQQTYVYNSGGYTATTSNVGMFNVLGSSNEHMDIPGTMIGTVYNTTSQSSSLFFDAQNAGTGTGTITATFSSPNTWLYGTPQGYNTSNYDPLGPRAQSYEIRILSGGSVNTTNFMFRRIPYIQSYGVPSFGNGWGPVFQIHSVLSSYISNNTYADPYFSIPASWGYTALVWNNGVLEFREYYLGLDNATLNTYQYNTPIILPVQIRNFVVDTNGNIWGTGLTSDTLYEFSPSGSIINSWSLSLPPSGTYYMDYEINTNTVWVTKNLSASSFTISTSSITNYNLVYPVNYGAMNFSVDANGNIWNADNNSHTAKISQANNAVLFTLPVSYTTTYMNRQLAQNYSNGGASFMSLLGTQVGANTSNNQYFNPVGYQFLYQAPANWGDYPYIYSIAPSQSSYIDYGNFSSNPKTFGWLGYSPTLSAFVPFNNNPISASSSVPIIDGVVLNFQDGSQQPSFVSYERYVVNVADGIVKDNLTQFKQDWALYFNALQPVTNDIYTIPTASPYTITISPQANPTFSSPTVSLGSFLKIDQYYPQNAVYINGQTTSQTQGTAQGQYQWNTNAGTYTFNSQNAGQQVSLTYRFMYRTL